MSESNRSSIFFTSELARAWEYSGVYDDKSHLLWLLFDRTLLSKGQLLPRCRPLHRPRDDRYYRHQPDRWGYALGLHFDRGSVGATDLFKHCAQFRVPQADKVKEIGECDDAIAVGIC